MLWVVRGTYAQTGEDVSMVVESETSEEAEYMAERRGIPVVIVGPASDEDIRAARAARRLYVAQPKPAYTCFGRPVGRVQLAALMLCGVATALMILHSSQVLSF